MNLTAIHALTIVYGCALTSVMWHPTQALTHSTLFYSTLLCSVLILYYPTPYIYSTYSVLLLYYSVLVLNYSVLVLNYSVLVLNYSVLLLGLCADLRWSVHTGALSGPERYAVSRTGATWGGD